MPANDDFKYNIKKMHRVFLYSVIAFTASTLLMLYRDHNDEWHEYQRIGNIVQAETLNRERGGALGAAEEYGARKKTLEDDIKSLGEELVTQNAEYARLRPEADELERLFDLKGREVRSVRAFRDVARANYDLGIRDAVSNDRLNELKVKFDDLQAKVIGLEKEWEVLETSRDAKLAELATVTAARDALDAELIAHTAEVTRITDALDQIAPEGLLKWAKRHAMTLPIIDGFNSHQKPVQDWLPDLMIKLGMVSTARFDRCRTCHVGIEKFATGNVPSFPHGTPESEEPLDWVAEGKFPHPYSSHPRPDVYLTATSPHPLNDFGCTICHDGTGSATSFHNAQHGPNSPVESDEWNEEYGYFYNHFWEYPMLPERLRESACLKCHHQVVELG